MLKKIRKQYEKEFTAEEARAVLRSLESILSYTEFKVVRCKSSKSETHLAKLTHEGKIHLLIKDEFGEKSEREVSLEEFSENYGF